jgi:carbonic anhydrase/acetyltransferase-like protein (isoleucine patch superfamily)
VIVNALELSLRGTSPLLITVGGMPQPWIVTVGLVQTSPTLFGTMSLSRTGLDEGTFELTLDLSPVVTFRRGMMTRTLDLGAITLTCTDGTWSPQSGSPTAALVASRLPLGLSLAGSLATSGFSMVLAAPGADSAAPGPASVAPTATVSSAAKLGRGCSIGDYATIDAGAVIGAGATIAAGAHVGSNAVVGDGAVVGTGSTIGSGAVVDSSTFILGSATIASGAEICGNCSVGTGCSVGANAKVACRCKLLDGCSIGAGAILGSDVNVGGGATVSSNIRFIDSAVIPAYTTQSASLSLYRLADGTTTIQEDGWDVAGPAAIVAQAGNQRYSSSCSMPTAPGSIEMTVSPIDPLNPPPHYGDLPNDVGNKTARPGRCGGLPTNPDYGDGDRQCVWFAEDLRARLAALTNADGTPTYKTTFTVTAKLNPDRHWWCPWRDKWIHGHALTDIHWPDDSVTWIEAQWSGDHGAVDGSTDSLDGNHDGKVTYSNGKTDEPTDGDTIVEVYDRREAAEAAGENICGKSNH